jgi:hypothetical protein
MSEPIAENLAPAPTDAADGLDRNPSYESGKHLPTQQYPSKDNPPESGQHLPTMPDPANSDPSNSDPSKRDPSRVQDPPTDSSEGFEQVGRLRAS